MNTVVWRLHSLISIKKTNDLGSKNKKNIRPLLFPRDRYPRLKKAGFHPGFHSLVCCNRPILIIKSGRIQLSPLKNG